MTQPERLSAETIAPGILAGKRGLVMGVANNRSIAWGIAKAARAARAPNSPSPIRASRSRSACGRLPRS